MSVHDAEGYLNAPLVGQDKVWRQEGIRYCVEGPGYVLPRLRMLALRLIQGQTNLAAQSTDFQTR